jgi:glutamyl endopeptidase
MVRRIRVHLIRTVGVIAALAAIAISLLGATSANAAAPAAPVRAVSHADVAMTAPMTIVRVARLVTSAPDRVGQVEVQLVDGAIVAIPAADKNLVMRRAAQDARPPRPDGKVNGNCGSSWIYLYDKANDHPERIVTGFHVNTGAIAYYWQATITGPQRTDLRFTASGTLALRTMWQANSSTTLDYPQGDYSAAVSKSSYALLWTGSLCTSAGPTAKAFLTSPDAPVDWKLATIVDSVPARTADTATAAPASTVSSIAGSTGTLAPNSVTGMSPNSVIGKDTRKRVNNTEEYPYSAIVLLNVYFPRGTYQCTGFLISPSLVVTAGHCVYDRQDGGDVVRVVAIPGNNATVEPFGYCLGTTAYTVTGWRPSQNDLYDYGAIKLNCSIGNTVGWFGWRWTSASLARTSVTITGYAGDRPPKGSMWTASGKISGSTERQVSYTISTGPSQSGSPVYQRGCKAYCAVAIHALGTDPPEHPLNEGTRITQAAFDNLEAWRS